LENWLYINVLVASCICVLDICILDRYENSCNYLHHLTSAEVKVSSDGNC